MEIAHVVISPNGFWLAIIHGRAALVSESPGDEAPLSPMLSPCARASASAVGLSHWPLAPLSPLVMAGLVPAIHVFLAARKQDVDARHKAGHDEVGDM